MSLSSSEGESVSSQPEGADESHHRRPGRTAKVPEAFVVGSRVNGGDRPSGVQQEVSTRPGSRPRHWWTTCTTRRTRGFRRRGRREGGVGSTGRRPGCSRDPCEGILSPDRETLTVHKGQFGGRGSRLETQNERGLVFTFGCGLSFTIAYGKNGYSQKCFLHRVILDPVSSRALVEDLFSLFLLAQTLLNVLTKKGPKI